MSTDLSKIIASLNGKHELKLDFDDALRVYKYKDVEIELSDDYLKIPEDFYFENDPDIIEYYPKISIEFPNIPDLENTTFVLRDDDINVMKKKDRDLNSDQLDILDEEGTVYFFELYHEDTCGKYRGYYEVDFSSIQSQSELTDLILNEAYTNYEWTQSPKSCYDEFIHGVKRFSPTDSAYDLTQDLSYLIRNERTEGVCSAKCVNGFFS